MQWDIGLEIGQTGVRLCTRERGETLVSPAWGASRKGETIALGDEALSMRGRTLRECRQAGRERLRGRSPAAGRLDRADTGAASVRLPPVQTLRRTG